MTTRLLFIHALSPLHAGTGQSVGAIDLPIARERATGIPFLPGSSLKGALRDRSDQQESLHQKTVGVFGPNTENASDHAGSVFFGDARLLLLPVRSIAGTFAWVTSPYLLKRFARDLREASLVTDKTAPAVPELANIRQCILTTDSKVKLNRQPASVIFEDLDFDPQNDSSVGEAWAKLIAKHLPTDTGLQGRFCIVHDDVMSYLVEHGTEVATRIRLDNDSKTVAKGALWTEESLPSESVLVSLLLIQPTKSSKLGAKDVEHHLEELSKGAIQLGGKATVGRGLCALHIAKGA
jgi:CRISPR-associated protein Cmr4